jgi:hypothetical protein
VRIRIETSEYEEGQAEVVNDRMVELIQDESTPTIAFMWDHVGEIWRGSAMWGGDGGANFEVDSEFAGQLTAMFAALKISAGAQ